MKVAVCGGVRSTALLIEKLVAARVGDLRIYGYQPSDPAGVSGWADLHALAAAHGLPFDGFRKVTEITPRLQSDRPDILFVVGLSQIVPPDIIGAARQHAIGFHPTALPQGRGRAALAWLVLTGQDGAASFFALGNGVDDGPIFSQTPFSVTAQDTAETVEAKMMAAMGRGLDAFLPALLAGQAQPVPQDADAATWFARRAPEDGWIDWRAPRAAIDALVRAATRPHPGARTLQGTTPITIWRVSDRVRAETGVPGRIMQVAADGSFTVQTGDHGLRVESWEAPEPWRPRVGQRLGYMLEAEVLALKDQLTALETRLRALEERR